jgi:hypothetical protein
MWMIRDGISFAVHELEHLSLRPSRMLQLAHKFSIEPWVAPNLQSLIRTPIVEITAGDAGQLGPKVLLVIAKAREALEKERKLISAYPPKLPSSWPSCWCASHSVCEKIWVEVWWKTVARSLLHPRDPHPLSEIVSLLERTPHPGMNSECKQDLIGYMASDIGSRPFQAEEKICESAILAVRQYYSM